MMPRIRALAATLAVLVIAATLPWASAQNAGPVTPGTSLAGIPLGAPIPEVVRRLGAPSTVRLVSPDGTLAYVFGQYGITVYVRDNTVAAVSTTNSILGTVRGIAMGAPEDVVIAAFGRPRGSGVVEGFPGILYESLGIAFGFDRRSVAVVMVFSPRGAAAPGSPAPQPAPARSQAPQDGVLGPAAGAPAPDELPEAPAAGTVPVPQGAEVVTPVPPGPISAPTAVISVPSGAAVTPGASSEPARPVVQGVAGRIPDVSHLRAYTAETRFLSLAGYLRYLVYGVTRQWVGAAETVQRMIQPVDGMLLP